MKNKPEKGQLERELPYLLTMVINRLPKWDDPPSRDIVLICQPFRKEF